VARVHEQRHAADPARRDAVEKLIVLVIDHLKVTRMAGNLPAVPSSGQPAGLLDGLVAPVREHPKTRECPAVWQC
jgi:hypothetical protein